MKISYKNYQATVHYCPEVCAFWGEVHNCIDVIGFQIAEPMQAFEALRVAVDNYLDLIKILALDLDSSLKP